MSRSRNRALAESVFQFHLRDLFKLVVLLSVYFALVRATGEFVAALGSGTFVLVGVITVLRVEATVRGALLGLCCSIAILILAGVAFPPASDWPLIIGWLIYPPLGYTLGILCSADRELRLG